MIQLSAHFCLEEFQKDEPIPAVCVPSFAVLCNSILEPARAYQGCALLLTSGYRDAQANLEAHGQPNSEHVGTSDYCAADFYPADGKTRALFDWMRQDSSLPFHQLILEHGANGSSVIHVSWNRQKVGVRSVLEGATHNSEPYAKVDYVAYQPDASGDIHFSDAT